MTEASAGPLKRTPLYDLHRELGARLVPFAGYEMPVQYPTGILAEHAQTRTACGLFDVSHMGQVRLTAKAGHSAAKAVETLVPGDIAGLQPGQQRYTQFTNDAGGILDDLMVTSTGDHLQLVVNAACKDADLAHIQARLSDSCEIEPMFSRGLLALQGPQAVTVLSRFAPSVATMKFMTGAFVVIDGARCYVTRSGYTGCDGYEISTLSRCGRSHRPQAAGASRGEADRARRPRFAAAGGRPLPLRPRHRHHDHAGRSGPAVEHRQGAPRAGRLPRRRGHPGAHREGAPRQRVGLLPEGKAIAREGAEIAIAGKIVGKVTSGGFAPTLGRAIAMGYVERAQSANGTKVELLVRGKPVPAEIVPMPFVKHAYYRG